MTVQERPAFRFIDPAPAAFCIGATAGTVTAITLIFLYSFGPTWETIDLADSASSFDNTNNYMYCGEDGQDLKCLGIHALNATIIVAGAAAVGVTANLIAKKCFQPNRSQYHEIG